ncbi:unnamed protein product [Ixodes pacificus]
MTQEGGGRIQETDRVRQEGLMAPPTGQRNSQVGNGTPKGVHADSEVTVQNGEKAIRVENEGNTDTEKVTSTEIERRTTLGQGQQERFEEVHAQLAELVRQSEADRIVIGLLAQRIAGLDHERQIEAARYMRLERRMKMQDKEPTGIEEEDTAPEAKGESVVPTTAG